jgi:glycosyltransferase involved in cell wall biosynthesis
MPIPRVSVVVDTYNHERFIEQALVSVLDQDFPPSEMEIVVVDDGSTDRTAEIVRKFEPRLRLISKPNGGQASAFNVGFHETRGELLSFLDGDDWWEKEKLKLSVATLDENPNVAAVGHGFYEVRDELPPTEMFLPTRTLRLDLASQDSARLADRARIFLGSCMITIRRRVLDLIMPIPLELVFCADAPIHTFALALGGAIVLDQPLFYYRFHSANLFAHSGASQERLRRRTETLAFLLAYLPPRLKELGVSPEIINTLLENDHVDLARLRLQDNQGGRLRNFQTEIAAFNASYKNASLAYHLFKGAVATMALVLSPRRFFQIRNWYARKKLNQLRGHFADADPTVPSDIFQRRPVVRQD